MLGEVQDSGVLFCWLRSIILLELEAESEALFGAEIEIDESFFGGRHKGQRVPRVAGEATTPSICQAFVISESIIQSVFCETAIASTGSIISGFR